MLIRHGTALEGGIMQAKKASAEEPKQGTGQKLVPLHFTVH